jgi:hypothetical protein
MMNNLFKVCSGEKAIIELPGAPMLLGAFLILISFIIVAFIYSKLRKERKLNDNKPPIEFAQ